MFQSLKMREHGEMRNVSPTVTDQQVFRGDFRQGTEKLSWASLQGTGDCRMPAFPEALGHD